MGWAVHKPSDFWEAADSFERAKGCTYRKIEISLPRELKPEQLLELVHDFVQQKIGDRYAYQFAIHSPKAAIEDDAKKSPSSLTERKAFNVAHRERWATLK